MHLLLRGVEIRRRSLYYNNIIVLPEFWTCSFRNETSFRRHYSYNVITMLVRVRQTIWIEEVFKKIKYTHEKKTVHFPYVELSSETSYRTRKTDGTPSRRAYTGSDPLRIFFLRSPPKWLTLNCHSSISIISLSCSVIGVLGWQVGGIF